MFYNGQIKLRLANEVQLRLAMSEGDNLRFTMSKSS
jgi:hypothetical protein